jgi:hypothetical protein
LVSIGGALQCQSRPGFGTEIDAHVSAHALQKLTLPAGHVPADRRELKSA